MNLEFKTEKGFIEEHEVQYMLAFLEKAHQMLHDRVGPGNEFTGWLDLPENYDKEEYSRVKAIAKEINEKANVFVVVGIGGSYLGTRAAMEALSHSFYNELPRDKRKGPKLYFLGNNLSPKYYTDFFQAIRGQDIYVNVVSKSGTTTEPAIAFRFIKEFMEDKYGPSGARERIIATTDKSRGALKLLSDELGYETFIIPDNIGGRYSIFTPVGLLPLAVVGIDTDLLLEGAMSAVVEYANPDISKNAAYQYAVARQIKRSKGKEIEILASYEPSLMFLGEWWKQLYGESEGKDGKGIFPASVSFTADLHSMGQLIQDGRRNIFETVIVIESANDDLTIFSNEQDLDGLNYLEGKELSYINRKAYEGTQLAHIAGDVPNFSICLPSLDEYYFGKLIYFFEKACAISGYLQGVNPFDQPGVEAYKKNMFKLLGKDF